MDQWGDRLSKIMHIRGLKKSLALAMALGVDESTISRWRKGGPITVPNAISLSRELDVSLDWLLAGRGQPQVMPQENSPNDLDLLHQKLDELPHAVTHALAELVHSLSELDLLHSAQ